VAVQENPYVSVQVEQFTIARGQWVSWEKTQKKAVCFEKSQYS
jgi:hypothetical protein